MCHNLEVTFSVEEQVFWLDIPVRDTLTMEIRYPHQDLLEAALDFTRAHSTENIESAWNVVGKRKVSGKRLHASRPSRRQTTSQKGFLGKAQKHRVPSCS